MKSENIIRVLTIRDLTEYISKIIYHDKFYRRPKNFYAYAINLDTIKHEPLGYCNFNKLG